MTELHGSLGTRGALKGQLGGAAGGGGVPYQNGAGLKVEENVLMVDAANAVEEDNTKPVTSAAVFVEIGNIEALLASL